AGNTADFARTDAFTLCAWAKPEGKGGVLLSKMDDADAFRGFDLGLVDGKVWVHIVHAWETNAIKVTSKQSLPAGKWKHITGSYDGSSKAAGIKLYVDGQPQELEVNKDALTGSIKTASAFHIGKRKASLPFNG